MTKPDTFGTKREQARAPLRVGLVNNMPDAALAQTERQFRDLLAAAAPERALELVLFSLPGVSRHPQIQARTESRYRPADQIAEARLDALIVTGAKPEAERLPDEPFWPGFARLVDQAVALRLPTLWSCLAAHAAVERLDGVKRRPLKDKISGVFQVAGAASDPLLHGLDRGGLVPHSRYNDLAEADLTAHGYRILTRSPEVGVDAFARPETPLFLFCQGHPEYDRDTLAFEYKRDFRAYLEGGRASPPALPVKAFDIETEQALARWARIAVSRRSPALMAEWPRPAKIEPREPEWRAFAVGFYGNWLRVSV